MNSHIFAKEVSMPISRIVGLNETGIGANQPDAQLHQPQSMELAHSSINTDIEKAPNDKLATVAQESAPKGLSQDELDVLQQGTIRICQNEISACITPEQQTIKDKIIQALRNGRLNPDNGDRYWHQYYLAIVPLVWARNLMDGYQIDVYSEKDGDHLLRIAFDSDITTATDNDFPKTRSVPAEMLKMHKLWLQGDDQAPRADFSDMDLSGMDMTKANLIGADLSGANLREVNFSGADLSDVKFDGARILCADFSGVNLSDTSFISASIATPSLLEGVIKNLKKSSAPSVDFMDANLANAIFHSAVIPRAKFDYANLEGASFYDADLRGADFTKARNLEGASFGGADLKGTKFPSGFYPDNSIS
jgi:uncharacterized protein YjbI with pentapeptide repeats